jgi:hypothetical protein
MLLSILELHAAIVFRQDSTSSRIATLRTIVFDPAGAVIPNAEVNFKGEKTVTANSGQDGSIRVQLPYGTYSVTVSRSGFKATKIIGLVIQAAKPPDLEVVLHLEHYCDDCGAGEGMGPQTITSDLPSAIEKRSSADLKPGSSAFTGYPPAVYMHVFLACPGDKPCTETEDIRVDPMPKGCCVLTVTNGDGRGTDEVSSYGVFLNGQRVLPSGKARNAQAAVKILQDNILKVVLTGGPHSKVFILIAYDPRESK